MFAATDQIIKAFKMDKDHPHFHTWNLADVRHQCTNYERLVKMVKPWQYRTFKNYVNITIIKVLKERKQEICQSKS